MTDDLLVSPQYWAVFAIVMIAFMAIKYRPLDFKFFVALPVAQRVAHTSMLPSSYLSSFVFSTMTVVLLILGYFLVRRLLPANPSVSTAAAPPFENFASFEARAYITIAALFLVTYYGVRFAVYPTFWTELDYTARLQAQYDHRAIFFLSQMTPPALAAIIVRWVVNGRLNTWDKLMAVVVFVGYISSGSKGAVAPVLMMYFGVSAYLQKQGLLKRAIWVIGAMVAIGAVSLNFLFPALSNVDILKVITYRIVANSEELEYLYVLNLQPGDYPFGGVGALFAPLAKFLGKNIEYTPGVWLYGQRYGNFTGFGPNAGFIIELFGNLGFFGLIVPLFIGGLIGYCERARTLYRVVILSILPLFFAESLMFFIALSGHLALMVAAKTVRFLFERRAEPHEGVGQEFDGPVTS